MNLLLETRRPMPGGPVGFQEFAPSSPLRAHVACFWTGVFGSAESLPYTHRVLPDGCVDIIFILNARSPKAVVIGPMLQPRLVVSRPNRDIGVRFYPTAALAFLRHSLATLQERVVPLDEFCGPDSSRLLEQLLVARGFASQVAVIETWLLARLRRSATPDPHVVQAVKWTYAERGRLQVRQLAKTVGLCERQLRRKFPVWTGYTPKQFVRVLRFQHALDALNRARERDDATVAAMHGYADQAHMIHEFHELGGDAPGRFRRLRHGGAEECPIFSILTPGTLRYHREP